MIRRRFFVLVTLAAVGFMIIFVVHKMRNSQRLSRLQHLQTLNRIAQKLPDAVNNFSSIHQHFVSVHLDSRVILRGRRFIRVSAVLRSDVYNAGFVCRLFDRDGVALLDKRDVEVKSITMAARMSKIGFGMNIGGYIFSEYMLSCPVPQSVGSSVDFLVIESPDRRFRSQVMPVTSPSPVSPVRLLVNCVPVTFGQVSERRLIEWLEAQRLLGVERVRLHFYRTVNPKLRQVADAYAAEGFVTVDDIQCPFCENNSYQNNQVHLLNAPLINKCLYEFQGQFKYTSSFDIDELIVPFQHSSYSELLRNLSAEFNTSSFAFHNWYHFFELGELSNVSQLNFPMLSHPYRTEHRSPNGYSTKSIHKSEHVMALHNHFCLEYLPDRPVKSRFEFVSENTGANEHFKPCHFDAKNCKEMTNRTTRDFGDRLNRLLGDRLKAAVMSRLSSLQMI